MNKYELVHTVHSSKEYQVEVHRMGIAHSHRQLLSKKWEFPETQAKTAERLRLGQCDILQAAHRADVHHQLGLKKEVAPQMLCGPYPEMLPVIYCYTVGLNLSPQRSSHPS